MAIELFETDETIQVEQSAADMATLAVTGALDLIEGAMIEAANKRAWHVLELLSSGRERLVFVQEMLQEESK